MRAKWPSASMHRAYARAAHIYDTVETVLKRASETGLRPEQVADRMVEEKLAA